MEGIIVIGVLVVACLFFARAMYKSSQGSCGCAACSLLNKEECEHDHNSDEEKEESEE